MATTHRLIDVDDSNFEEQLSSSAEPVLIDFGATWCRPCKLLEPIVERLAERRAGKLRVMRVNMDDAPQLAARFGIRAAPTLVLLADGAMRGRHVGLVSDEKLDALVASWLEPASPRKEPLALPR